MFLLVIGASVIVAVGIVLLSVIDTPAKKQTRRSLHDLDLEEARVRKQSRRWWYVIFAGLALISLPASLIFLIYGLREIPKIGPDGEWPTVIGYVYQTRVVYQSSSRTSYYAVIGTVNYEVSGRAYSARHELARRGNQGAAEEIAPTFLGRQLTVWYDPTQPQRVDFNPVTWAFPLVFIAGAAITMSIGLGALHFLTKPPKPKTELVSSPFV